MNVKLTFFKDTGKYYSGATYESDLPASEPIYRFWEEVERMRVNRDSRTGLSSGGADFFCVIEIPDHSMSHPRMLLPVDATEGSAK